MQNHIDHTSMFFSYMIFFMTPKTFSTLSNIFTSWKVARPLSLSFFKTVVAFFPMSFQVVIRWKWSIRTNKTSVWVHLVDAGHMDIIKFFIFKSCIANSAFVLKSTSGNSLCRWRLYLWRLFIELFNAMEIIIVRLKLRFVGKALSIRFVTAKVGEIQWFRISRAADPCR